MLEAHGVSIETSGVLWGPWGFNFGVTWDFDL